MNYFLYNVIPLVFVIFAGALALQGATLWPVVFLGGAVVFSKIPPEDEKVERRNRIGLK